MGTFGPIEGLLPGSFGEANLKGPLSGGGPAAKEEPGSPAYVPPDPKDDTQLNYAFDEIGNPALRSVRSMRKVRVQRAR